MRIGFDLDGVLADIVRQLRLFSRRQFDVKFSSEELTSENAEDCVPLSRSQLIQLFCEPTFFRGMRPISGAREGLELLRARGTSIHIVTDRFWYPGLHDDTVRWLKQKNIPHDSLHFARKTEKQHVVTQLSLDVFVEDQRSNANLVSGHCVVLLINKPYNQGPLGSNVSRVSSLQHALDALKGCYDG